MESLVLLAGIKKGCKKNFQEFFILYYEELVQYSHKFVFDKALAEDVVQEVFIYIWENSEKVNPQATMRGYLYSMVRNRALNELKKLKITDSLNYLEELRHHESISENPEEFDKNTYEAVRTIISRMPEKMRIIFELKHLLGYSSEEICKELNLSSNTVKTQLYRAKSRIRHSFQALLIFFLFS